MFSVNALFYGDFVDLTARCLGSILDRADWSLIDEFRLGLNQVSDRTRGLIRTFVHELPVPCHLYEEVSGRNVWKYPLMRRMFYDTKRPITSRSIMWFDDDSYLTGPKTKEWWTKVAVLLSSRDMLGALYQLNCGWRTGQVEGIKAQPWYNGKPVHARPTFITGGWWAARREILVKHDYPFPELQHNNGDVLLGQLCYQQDYSVQHFNEGVAINADWQGRESRAKRRGGGTPWPWEAGRTPDLSHHNFDVAVTTYQPKEKVSV